MLTIRVETAKDHDQIRYVNEQAFRRSSESDLVDKLRNRSALPVSLVALQKDSIAGHIAFSPATIKSGDTQSEIITLAPLAVLPAFQKQGTGSELVRAGVSTTAIDLRPSI